VLVHAIIENAEIYLMDPEQNFTLRVVHPFFRISRVFSMPVAGLFPRHACTLLQSQPDPGDTGIQCMYNNGTV